MITMLYKTALGLVMTLTVFSSLNCNEAKADHAENNAAVKYVCTPCGYACDSTEYTQPGTCKQCSMGLVDKSTIVHKNIEPVNLCSLDEQKIIFLDVRTAAEFNGTADQKFGALKNAINIPIQELDARINELEKYKDNEIIVYCSHSHRSPQASYKLTQKGFKHVTNMLGGMSVWKDEVRNTVCNEKFYVSQ